MISAILRAVSSAVHVLGFKGGTALTKPAQKSPPPKRLKDCIWVNKEDRCTALFWGEKQMPQGFIGEEFTDHLKDAIGKPGDMQDWELVLVLDSFGGDARRAQYTMYLLDKVRQEGGRITVIVEGKACSVASLLAVAGDKGSRYLLNEGYIGTHGNVPDSTHPFGGELAVETNQWQTETFSHFTGQPETETSQWVPSQTMRIFRNDEAVHCGLVDAVGIPQKYEKLMLLKDGDSLEKE